MANITSIEKRTAFLLTVLDAEEKRRSSIENRSAILIASNAVLLNAIIGLGISFLSNNMLGWLKIIFTITALMSVVLSTLWSIQVLAPFGRKQRSKMLDLGNQPEKEHNLFLFTQISAFSKKDYFQEINNLTNRQILEQLSFQTHNLSRILTNRYKLAARAYIAFIVGTAAFAILAFTKIFL